MMKLQTKPFDINITQIYAPNQDHDKEDIEEFYEEVQLAIKKTKPRDKVYVMEYFKAKVGQVNRTDIVRNHGIGERSEREERLIPFCQ